MTRNEFLSRLRRGLEGLSPDYIQDVMNDYEAHFTDGLANGRTEYEISHALGDPGRVARELKAEAGFRRWEADRTAGNMAGAVLALLGLAAEDRQKRGPCRGPFSFPTQGYSFTSSRH